MCRYLQFNFVLDLGSVIVTEHTKHLTFVGTKPSGCQANFLSLNPLLVSGDKLLNACLC